MARAELLDWRGVGEFARVRAEEKSGHVAFSLAACAERQDNRGANTH
jgi:hypothetical protein